MKTRTIRTEIIGGVTAISKVSKGKTGNYNDSRIQIREISNVPDGVSDEQLAVRFDRTIDLTCLKRFSDTPRMGFDYSELGEGKIIKC